MDGLTTVRVEYAPPRKRRRSATTFTPIWTVSVAQVQEEQISLTSPLVRSLMAPANQWGTLILTVGTAIFSERRRETFRPITCRHRKAEILRQVRLQPGMETTAHSQWTSSAAEC